MKQILFSECIPNFLPYECFAMLMMTCQILVLGQNTKGVTWGPCLPLNLIIEVVCRGSLLFVDAFDVSLRGTYHETLTRGVMTPPAGVRAGG